MENSISNLIELNYRLYNIKIWYYNMSGYRNGEKFIFSDVDISLSRYDNVDNFIIDWSYEESSYSIFLIYFW